MQSREIDVKELFQAIGQLYFENMLLRQALAETKPNELDKNNGVSSSDASQERSVSS